MMFSTLMETFVVQGSAQRCVTVLILTFCLGFFFTASAQIPDEPRNVRADVISARKIRVSWDAPEGAEGITEYQLDYHNGDSRQFNSVHIAASVSSYLLDNLTPDTVYYIRVSASSVIGRGPATPMIMIMTPSLTVPDEPRNVRADVISAHKIRVSWDAPEGAEGITGYQLDYHNGDSRQINSVHIAASVSSYLLDNLKPDTVYYIRVSASSVIGRGPATPMMMIKTPSLTVPDEPRNLRADVISAHKIRVSWDAPEGAEGITEYQLDYHYGDSGQFNSVHLAASVSSYLLDNLTPDTVYYIRVSASSVIGRGPPTPTIQISTPALV